MMKVMLGLVLLFALFTPSISLKIRHHCQDLQELADQLEAAKRPWLGYHGEMLGMFRHGFGTFRDYDGSVYVGNWEMGKRSEQGTQLFASTPRDKRLDSLIQIHDIYQGEWAHGLPHGQGALITVGGIYRGEWVQGQVMNFRAGNWKAFVGDDAYDMLVKTIVG